MKMWAKYDENLSNNPFFKEIIQHHNDIVKKCSEEPWIICIPRAGTLDESDLTSMDHILDHILVPNTQENYCTLSKKHVTVKNQRINIQPSDLFNNSVEILFEETFYIEKSQKYTVWCIDSPLFINYNFCDSHHTTNLEDLHDCIDFLWVESLGHEILEHIQKLAEGFRLEHEDFEIESLQTQKDLVGNLYSQCLQVSFENFHIKEKSNSEPFLDNLKIAVETYMQHCLGKKLVFSVNTVCWQKDSYFNKIVRNSNDLQFQDLNISNDFCDIITVAKCELSKINCFVTVLDKINCLKRTFNAFYTAGNNVKNTCCITADEIIQMLVFLILKLNINNWISNLVYIKEFRFSLLEYSDQISYFITSLEAAIEFIKSTQFLDVKIQSKKDCNISDIFTKVLQDDFEGVKREMKQNQANVYCEHNLCHPLCTCSNCDSLMKNNTGNLSSSLKICNENGQNLLTHATICGNCSFVEYFLKEGADVNASDYFNKTPLHYAASKGFQDILLLLITAKANINALDSNKNSPLHLACDNGHENCVKALLYSSRNVRVNVSNNFGETPVYLATKWGYMDIVKLLLEHGASPSIKSKRNKSAGDVATNYYVLKLLTSDCNRAVLDETKDALASKDCGGFKLESKEHGVRPKTVEQFKKIDLLLKAIENNDFPLTCFYLGFNSVVNNRTVDGEIGGKCHPLCDCNNCRDKDFVDENDSLVTPLEHININTCNVNGYAPLHVAAKFGRAEILRLLLDSCAFPNVKTYKRLYTPLHVACIYQRIQIVKELLKCGECKVDVQDFQGNTPLYYACVKNDCKIVEILLSNGADCTKRNCSGRTILQESEGKMPYRIFKMLKSNLVNVLLKSQDLRDEDDWLN